MHKALIIILIYIALPTFCSAQYSLTKKEIKKQQSDFLLPGNPWTLEIPLWIPGFAGDFVYGDISIEGEDGIQNPIEPPPPSGGIGDIISRLFTINWYLKFFYLTNVAYEPNKIKVQFDMIAGAVGNSVVFNYNDKELVSASIRSVNTRLYAGYKIVDAEGANNNFRYELIAYGGMRIYFQRLQTELSRSGYKLDINPVFVQPMIGLENQFTWKRWLVLFQGDFGNILSADKNSYLISSNVYYRMGRLTSLKFGWIHLHVSQKGKFIQKDYRVKMTLSGPTAALAFHF